MDVYTPISVGCVRISFEEKMQVVHQFMFENKLGKGLLQRVDHYFTLLWQQFRYIFYPHNYYTIISSADLIIETGLSLQPYISTFSDKKQVKSEHHSKVLHNIFHHQSDIDHCCWLSQAV